MLLGSPMPAMMLMMGMLLDRPLEIPRKKNLCQIPESAKRYRQTLCYAHMMLVCVQPIRCHACISGLWMLSIIWDIRVVFFKENKNTYNVIIHYDSWSVFFFSSIFFLLDVQHVYRPQIQFFFHVAKIFIFYVCKICRYLTTWWTTSTWCVVWFVCCMYQPYDAYTIVWMKIQTHKTNSHIQTYIWPGFNVFSADTL